MCHWSCIISSSICVLRSGLQQQKKIEKKYSKFKHVIFIFKDNVESFV